MLQKAVELGEPLAKVNLALAYYNGTGIKQDQDKAYQLVLEAAVPQAIELLQGAQTDANGCREVQSKVDGKIYTAIECPMN